MRMIRAYPPNYAALKKRFNLPPAPKVLFSFGDVFYNPAGIVVSPFLVAHEEAHGPRQLDMGVLDWWQRYIDDPKFLFDEELVAHRAEYQSFRAEVNDQGWRHAHYLNEIAHRLAGSLYGKVCTPSEAMAAIRGGSDGQRIGQAGPGESEAESAHSGDS